MSLRYKNRPVDVKSVLARIEQEKASARLTIGEATALIAFRTQPRDTEREGKNLIRMQIHRALEAGESDPEVRDDDAELVAEPDGRIAIGELIKWATVNYGHHFDDLPRKPRTLNPSIHENIVFNGPMGGIALPSSLDRAHAEITRLHGEVQRLEKDAASAEVQRKQELVARFKRE